MPLTTVHAGHQKATAQSHPLRAIGTSLQAKLPESQAVYRYEFNRLWHHFGNDLDKAERAISGNCPVHLPISAVLFQIVEIPLPAISHPKGSLESIIRSHFGSFAPSAL